MSEDDLYVYRDTDRHPYYIDLSLYYLGGFKFVIGDKGLGGWTTAPDKDGWYESFYCKPVGPGARTGQSLSFQIVRRLSARRRTKKACKLRSFNLAQGKPALAHVKAKPKTVNPPGTGYCMSCREKVIMVDARNITTTNGRNMIRGECPSCQTAIQKYGRVIHCPECLMDNEAGADDYICKECRAASS